MSIRTSRQTTHTLNAQLGFGIANTHIGGANLVQASLLQGEQHGFGDCLATELELEGIGAILAACRSGHGARVVGAANVLERSVDRIGDPHRFMRCGGRNFVHALLAHVRLLAAQRIVLPAIKRPRT